MGSPQLVSEPFFDPEMIDSRNPSQLNQQYQGIQQQLSQLMKMMEKISKKLDDVSLQVHANTEAIQKIQKNQGKKFQENSQENLNIVENQTADIIQEPRKLRIKKKVSRSEKQNQASNVSTSWPQTLVPTYMQLQRRIDLEVPLKSSCNVTLAMAAKGKILLRELKTQCRPWRRRRRKKSCSSSILIKSEKRNEMIGITLTLVDDVFVIFDPGGVHQENREKEWWSRHWNPPELRRWWMMKWGGNLEKEQRRWRRNLPQLRRRQQMTKSGGENSSTTNQPSIIKDEGLRSSFWQSQSKLTTCLGSTAEMERKLEGGKLGSYDIKGRA